MRKVNSSCRGAVAQRRPKRRSKLSCLQASSGKSPSAGRRSESTCSELRLEFPSWMNGGGWRYSGRHNRDASTWSISNLWNGRNLQPETVDERHAVEIPRRRRTEYTSTFTVSRATCSRGKPIQGWRTRPPSTTGDKGARHGEGRWGTRDRCQDRDVDVNVDMGSTSPLAGNITAAVGVLYSVFRKASLISYLPPYLDLAKPSRFTLGKVSCSVVLLTIDSMTLVTAVGRGNRSSATIIYQAIVEFASRFAPPWGKPHRRRVGFPWITVFFQGARVRVERGTLLT